MKAVQLNLNEWMGLGLDPRDLTLFQLVFRAIVVFGTMYFMVRIAGRRFMAQKNIFDVVLAFLVASLLARAINGSASFWANIGLGFIIAVGYRLIAWLACEVPIFGTLLKGRAVAIVVNGEVKRSALKKHHVSRHDLEEDLRLAGNIGDLAAVKLARLERSGDISVERKPQIFKVAVENGVQVIELRIQ